MLVQVFGRLAEVVVADDPLGFAEARNRAGDILFQIDVLDAFGDGGPQQQQPRLLGPLPAAAIDLPAAGDDHRRGPIGQQPLEVHLAVDVIQAQLDQLGPCSTRCLCSAIMCRCRPRPMLTQSMRDEGEG